MTFVQQVYPIGMNAVKLDNPQTLNLYAYCANDPINCIDPDGLSFKKLAKIFKWVAAVIAVAAFVALMPGAGGAVASKFIVALKNAGKFIAKKALSSIGINANITSGASNATATIAGAQASTKKAVFATIQSGAKATSASLDAVGVKDKRWSAAFGLLGGGFGMAALGRSAKVGDWASFGLNTASNTAYVTGYKEIGAITGMMAGLFDAAATAFNRWGPQGIRGELFAYPVDGMYELGTYMPRPNRYAELKITASVSRRCPNSS